MSIPAQRWVYRAAPVRAVDGDTIVVIVDVGFGLHLHPGNEGAHLRLLRVDTPERAEPNWIDATTFTAAWLAEAGAGWSLTIQTERADSFGRYLAEVWRIADGANLSDDLLASGLAVPYERN